MFQEYYLNDNNLKVFMWLKYVVHWTQEYAQGVHEDHPIHCCDERYEIIATPINLKKIADFDLEK